MKRVPVKIMLRAINPDDPTEISVMGYEFLPGLFIHRSLSWGTNEQTKWNYWDITHKSGFNLCCFTDETRTRKSILEPAIELLGGLDWTWDALPADTKKHAEAVLQLKSEINSLPRYRR